MVDIANTEVCLEIDHDLEVQLLNIDQQYLDGLILKTEMANKVGWLIREYLIKNELVLVKIIKPSN